MTISNNILDIVADILEAPNTFCGILPESPDALTALFEYSSAPPAHFFDRTDLSFAVQVRTRAKKSDTAYQKALDTQTKLNRYSDNQLVIRQTSSILDIGQDSKGRQEYTVNFKIDFKE